MYISYHLVGGCSFAGFVHINKRLIVSSRGVVVLVLGILDAVGNLGVIPGVLMS